MSTAKTIKADKSLQLKVGTGPLDKNILEKCQKVMDDNIVDFAPTATEFLDKLAEAIENAQRNEDTLNNKQAIASLTSPVMQLKANASMFRYDLVGNLAHIMLSFLESVHNLDNEAIQIVEAHHKTLSAIVLKKMSGDGGENGKQLENELKGACKRYFQKRK